MQLQSRKATYKGDEVPYKGAPLGTLGPGHFTRSPFDHSPLMTWPLSVRVPDQTRGAMLGHCY